MPWLRLIANTEADRAKPKALTVIPHRDVVDIDNVEEEADDLVADQQLHATVILQQSHQLAVLGVSVLLRMQLIRGGQTKVKLV